MHLSHENKNDFGIIRKNGIHNFRNYFNEHNACLF